MLFVRNTDRLFKPGRFRFNTCQANDMSVELLDLLTPDYQSADFSLAGLMDRVRGLMVAQADRAC